MRTRVERGLLAVGIFIFSGLLLCWMANVSAAAPEGVLKYAIHWGLSADDNDPSIGGWTNTADMQMRLLHESLLKPMPDGMYSPCLAESWTTSPDFKVYEFKLRKGVKFHNGDTVTAEDVAFTFWRYKTANAKLIQGKTEKVEAVNPNLVRFQFKEPFPDFLEYFTPGMSSIGWVVPKKYIEKVGDAGYKKHPVGAGPYKFVEFVPGIKLVVEAFDGYWRKVPNVKRLEFNIIPEPSTRLTMVRRGEVDIATLLTSVFYEDMKKDPKLRVMAPLSATRWIVYFTSQWDPKSPWSDPRVRLAASLAIDRQTLADVHMPGCGGIGSLGLEDIDPQAAKIAPDPYDPKRAKELLAEAGYPKGFNGGKYFPFESGYWPYGEQIANYWKAIGITMETVLLDRPAWFAQRDGGKMKGGTFIDPVMAGTTGGRLTYLFGSGSYGNYPDIQTTWDRYRREINPKTRQDMIMQVQKMVHEKRMFLPLTSTNSPAAFGPKVKGNPYKVQPLAWFTTPFEDIELFP